LPKYESTEFERVNRLEDGLRHKAVSLWAERNPESQVEMADPFPVEKAQKIDIRAVHKTYERWPALARDGFKIKIELPKKRMRRAYVLGMGGSASGGDIIAGWLFGKSGREMAVFKGEFPVGDLSSTLAIACSASGQTEETITMLKTAVERHATVVSISGGGRLKEISEKLGVPHVQMPEVVAPRYMLPFMIFSTLAIVNQGLELGCEGEVEEAFPAMEAEGREIAISTGPLKNGAKALAHAILNKTPSIYGAIVTRGVGIRFKNILNENAKIHSHFDEIPDAFHNEIEAWEDPRLDFAPIFLRHSAESKHDRTREDRMIDILSAAGKAPIQVRGRGESSLAQLVSMVYRLDMVSYYVALGLGRDPFPTKLIDSLKKKS
jgi:glucose/mannose-6-phosphate isomerase